MNGKSTTLAELVELTVGYAFKSRKYSLTEAGSRLVRGENVAQGHLRWDNTKWWADSSDIDARYSLDEGDLVLAMDRPWIEAGLKYAQVSARDLPALLVQRVARLRARGGVDQRYLYYVLGGRAFTNHVLAVQTGTSIPHISGSQILSFRLVPHSLAEQGGISEILGALDDKIAANRELALSLEALAIAEFEFTRSSATANARLSEVVTTQYGLTTSARSEPGPKFLRVTDINKSPWVDWEGAPNCSVEEPDLLKYRVEAGDILVARMADPGKACFIDEDHPEAVFASYLVRLKATEPSSALYIYYFLRSDQYKRYAASAMQGTVQKNMNAKVIVSTEIPMPTADGIARFVEKVEPLRRSARATQVESRKLAELRDTLLPELMSGRLRVKDAEKKIEEVV